MSVTREELIIAVQRFCRENENLLMYNFDFEELYEIFIEDNAEVIEFDEFVQIINRL